MSDFNKISDFFGDHRPKLFYHNYGKASISMVYNIGGGFREPRENRMPNKYFTEVANEKYDACMTGALHYNEITKKISYAYRRISEFILVCGYVRTGKNKVNKMSSFIDENSKFCKFKSRS